MHIYKNAFLFNGIGTNHEKLFSEMPSVLSERFYSYQSDIFHRFNLYTDLEKNSPLDKILACWFISDISDRVVSETYIEKGIKADIGAGYSSGLLNTCACFSAFSFDFSYELFYLNKTTIMSAWTNNEKLDMGIIIGMDNDTVREIIHSLDLQKRVVIGSVNSSVCVMISGYADDVQTVLDKSAEEGALKSIRMNQPIAYHNEFIAPYCRQYIDFCSSIEYNDPIVPIISAFDQHMITQKEDLIEENIKNLTSPMRWDLTINKLQELGVTAFYDTSINGAIKKFTRWNKRKSVFYTIHDVL